MLHRVVSAMLKNLIAREPNPPLEVMNRLGYTPLMSSMCNDLTRHTVPHAVGGYWRFLPVSLGPPYEWCGTVCSNIPGTKSRGFPLWADWLDRSA